MYPMTILSLTTINKDNNKHNNKDNTQLLRDNILSLYSILLSTTRILIEIVLLLDK
jgi:hypothetical protein